MLWALACAVADPELERAARALAAWEEGKALLDDGDAAGARRAFERASTERASPLLASWEAKAAADMGDLEAAVGRLEAALGEAPSYAEARYNRAAYLARLGRPEEAAPELERALGDGAGTPLSVLEDPDFARYLAHPAFAFLPQQALTVATEVPSGTLFVGSDVSVRFRLIGLVRDPIRVVPEESTGHLQLTTVVDDMVRTSQGPSRDLSWTWKVVEAGAVTIGPTVVHADKYEAQVARIAFVGLAPEDYPAANGEEPDLVSVRAVLDSVPPRSAGVGYGGRWVARLGRGDVVSAERPTRAPARLELRENGEVVEAAAMWPRGVVPEGLVIRDSGGQVVHETLRAGGTDALPPGERRAPPG